jgi:CheY-like chemotaxis protein
VARHDKSILVVDDDLQVLEVMSHILRTDGFDVASAGGSGDALSTVVAGGRFDLLVTDVRMPGSLDGFGVARALRRHLPRIEVIYVSGWVETLPKLDDYVLGPLLSKPVRPDALCRAARQILRVA